MSSRLPRLVAESKWQRQEEREEDGEGSLTSLAKQVFLPHIEMQVLNAQLAFLEVNLLQRAVAAVIHGAFPLLRRVVTHGHVGM